MSKIFPVGLGLCLIAASVQAQDVSADAALQAEFELNKNKINEIFQDKIQKITARAALPEDMRKVLISQADEIRQFDQEMLQKKMELKIKHAKQRDEIKETLRQDARNRAKWLLEDEENFQKKKTENENKEKAVSDDMKNISNTSGTDKDSKKEGTENNTTDGKRDGEMKGKDPAGELNAEKKEKSAE